MTLCGSSYLPLKLLFFTSPTPHFSRISSFLYNAFLSNESLPSRRLLSFFGAIANPCTSLVWLCDLTTSLQLCRSSSKIWNTSPSSSWSSSPSKSVFQSLSQLMHTSLAQRTLDFSTCHGSTNSLAEVAAQNEIALSWSRTVVERKSSRPSTRPLQQPQVQQQQNSEHTWSPQEIWKCSSSSWDWK